MKHIRQKRTGLAAKITILTTVVIFISLVISGVFSIWMEMKTIQNYSEITVMNIAQSLARDNEIIVSLKTGNKKRCNSYVNNKRQALTNIRFITVCDMNSIRYAHPDPEKVGKIFVGGDNKRIIETGESYISVATGTLGKSLRAFAPVIDHSGKQIGFITSGTLISNIAEIKSQSLYFFYISFAISLFFGFSGSALLAGNIKKTLLGLEPYEIIQLYNEKKGMLNAIHEGILAIDNSCRITMINESALKILNVDTDPAEIIGKDIVDIFPSTKLLDVMKQGENQYNQEDVINQTLVVANRIVIRDRNRITGAIATFQDKTMLTLLAEEITGVNQIIGALRASNHEFKNKLHVILGFIHSGKYRNAENFIMDITEDHEQRAYSITKKIKNATIAALVLGKLSRARELSIDFDIDDLSFLGEDSYIYNNDLITIIGNLLENSFEAVEKKAGKERNVYLFIKDDPGIIKITVRDTGNGIEEHDAYSVFERGYTTKSKSNGVGLDLVQKSIKNLNGEFDITSEPGKGTEINITLKTGGSL